MNDKILSGIKVLDFTTAATGPITSMIFADYGATVIHLESKTHVDPLRVAPPFKDNISGLNRSPFHANYNRGKYGITLNLNHPKGLELAKRLVAWADIFVENYTPGVMAKWGMDYPNVKDINPDIIMISLSMHGHSGPLSKGRGFGLQAVAAVGYGEITGYPESGPSQPYGAYIDFIAGPFGALALLSALYHREITGEGQFIDLSMIEASIHFLSPVFMDYSCNKTESRRIGNHHPYASPHGVYPCKGKDMWCAISVFTDEEWLALCDVFNAEDLRENPSFETALSRKQNEDLLDQLIVAYTQKMTAEQVMSLLQDAGIASAIVQNSEYVFKDPQLAHREHFFYLDHPEIGRHAYDSMGFKLSGQNPIPEKPAPCLGEHNKFIYSEVLHLTDQEYSDLLSEGAFE
jgi:benzylsuccinate CoA-transferase BbsF subunit